MQHRLQLSRLSQCQLASSNVWRGLSLLCHRPGCTHPANQAPSPLTVLAVHDPKFWEVAALKKQWGPVV
jgi:hypothetical protein